MRKWRQRQRNGGATAREMCGVQRIFKNWQDHAVSADEKSSGDRERLKKGEEEEQRWDHSIGFLRREEGDGIHVAVRNRP